MGHRDQMIELSHEPEIKATIKFTAQTNHDPGMSCGQQDNRSTKLPTQQISKQVRFIVVCVNDINIVSGHDISQSAQYTEIEFASLFNLIESQASRTGFLRDAELMIPHVSNIGYDHLYFGAVVSLGRQQDGLIRPPAPFIRIT
jgi:hypothetical protein